MAPQAIDVTRFIDERKMNRFNALIVIFCFFIILFDGYDIGAVGAAGPSLVKLWGLTDMRALAVAFSSGLFGILFGSPILGWIGDRYGRNKAIVASCMIIGVFSLATMGAADLHQLIVLRFFTGIGIGGMLPNTIALNAEYAPRRRRATMIIVMFTGITFGGGLPGPVGAWLVPLYGWKILFLIGGILPLVVGIAAAIWLPESLKFLVIRGDRARVQRTVRAMQPDLALGGDASFAVSDETVYAKFRPTQLFQEGLHFITPLLWVCFICNLMTFYFANAWLPTVLTAAHVPPAHAQLSLFAFQIGGTLGGLALSVPIDRHGLMPVCALFVVSMLIAPWIGFAIGTEWLLMTMVFLSGFTLLGLQFGVNAVSALIYPTSIRSNGSGWAFAVGRFGSIAGPLLAGQLLSMKLPLTQFFMWLLAPLAVGTVASFILARLYYTRFEGMGLHRRDAMDEAARGRAAS